MLPQCVLMAPARRRMRSSSLPSDSMAKLALLSLTVSQLTARAIVSSPN